MKFKLRGSTNLLKIVLSLGISISLWNCENDDYYHEQKQEFKIKDASTVSFQEAIKEFNSINENISNLESLRSKNAEDQIELIPNWNSLQHSEIAYTNAQLTTAETAVNRSGEYNSKLCFLNINGVTKSVIFTTFIRHTDTNGNIIDANVFFNTIAGEFVDGFRIENGKFTKRYIPQKNQTQRASLLSLFMFFQNDDDDFWCSDEPLDEVDLGTIGNTSGNITTTGNQSGGAGYSDSYLFYNTIGVNSGTLGSYVNGATGGIGVTGGGGTTHNSLSTGQITSVAGAILVVLPVDPDINGNCPTGYVKNPQSGKCEYVCGGGKRFNELTQECECPEGTMENLEGTCVADCTPNCMDQINCITRNGLLHEANFRNNSPILGNNITTKSDNFRNDNWGIIQETDCGNGKIPKGSNVNVLSITPVIRTLSNGTKLKYYRIEYYDCPKGNNKTNGNFDQNKPCSDCFKGNPVKNPKIAAQLGASGIRGGMYGLTRNSNTKWHRGVDIITNFGDPIYAMFDGNATLEQQGNGDEGAGYYIILTSIINGKTVKTLYFHMQKDSRVSGDVKAGDIIGYQGDSGNLKKAIKQGYAVTHLHVKVKENGIVVDPEEYMKTSFDDINGTATNSTDCE
ncbi:hypothetical protein T190611E02C_10240 [Tenacibaculum sp. 190524A05c]|uniref:M23 family metallopeptidase n=1 Tax=Tenacibaculum platacis TaxID=3137852 RepID=UPI0031FB6CBF